MHIPRPSIPLYNEMQQSTGQKEKKTNLESIFAKIPTDTILKQKQLATVPFKQLPKESLEIGVDEVCNIDLPKRPAWFAGETKGVLFLNFVVF